MTIRWPRHHLVPQEPMFAFTPMSIHGPFGGTGVSDISEGDQGYWRVTFGSVVVTRKDRIQTWNAISAILGGLETPILIPYCRGRQPVPPDSAGLYDEMLLDDGTAFDDGTGYAGGAIEVRLAADLARDSAYAIVDFTSIGAVQPGHKFSFAERLYEIRKIETYGSHHRIKVRPNFRDAALDGAELNFDDPVCRCRLASDVEMDLPLGLNKRAMPTVNLVEDLLT